MPYGAPGWGDSTRITVTGGMSLGRMMSRLRSVVLSGPAVGVGREALGQRVAETHVDGALDLALAQLRVDGAADVVDGDHPLDVARLRVEHHELGGVAERRVDDRVLEALAERVRPVDPVLALVVDADLAPVGERGLARLGHRTGAHQRAAAPGGLAGAELAGGVDDHVDAGRVDPELLDGDLLGDGVDALAHLGPAVAHLDPAVVAEAHDGLGDLLEPVAETRVLEPEPEAERLAAGDGVVVVAA